MHGVRTLVRALEPLPLLHHPGDLRIRVRAPRKRAHGPHLPQRHAEREHVALLRVSPPRDRLRRHPPQRARLSAVRAHRRHARAVHSESVVCDFERHLPVVRAVHAEDEHVAGGEVAVDDLVQRKLRHPVANLHSRGEHDLRAEGGASVLVALEERIERPLLRKLRDKALLPGRVGAYGEQLREGRVPAELLEDGLLCVDAA
mmetsp:Transcript_5269/g.12308  ORF Transcript_5269/g.12308 Transcript_5269/m.12308 type:complete len:202 (-) Transcript_5269:1767-2372(-)